jgi:hypothetical protein
MKASEARRLATGRAGAWAAHIAAIAARGALSTWIHVYVSSYREVVEDLQRHGYSVEVTSWSGAAATLYVDWSDA